MSNLLYLDQNVWIDVAHSLNDKQNGPYSSLSRLIIKNDIITPISSEHIIELSKIDDISHRMKIATVMLELSHGWFLADEHSLVVRELQRAFARKFNKHVPNAPPIIGRGLHFAFGKSDTLYHDLSRGIQNIDIVKKRLESPDAQLFLLVGSNDEAARSLMADLQKSAVSFANKVNSLREKAKSHSKAIRKRAYIADLTFQLQYELHKILHAYGHSLDWFLKWGTTELMEFFTSIPCLNVEMEVSVARDEYWNRSVDPNDLYDVSFLSVAIPYCQHVVTERHWVHIAQSRGLDQKYSTRMYSNLSDLFELFSVEFDAG